MTKAETKISELVNQINGILERGFSNSLEFTIKIDYMNNNLKSDMIALVLNRIENRKRLNKSFEVLTIIKNSINKAII